MIGDQTTRVSTVLNWVWNGPREVQTTLPPLQLSLDGSESEAETPKSPAPPPIPEKDEASRSLWFSRANAQPRPLGRSVSSVAGAELVREPPTPTTPGSGKSPGIMRSFTFSKGESLWERKRKEAERESGRMVEAVQTATPKVGNAPADLSESEESEESESAGTDDSEGSDSDSSSDTGTESETDSD
ncbi:hypothetical protein HDU93_004365, partial [Gonapodya sp. JEL0774]